MSPPLLSADSSIHRMERLSLGQQIARLEDVAPADLDPDINAARAHYFDIGPSPLRKLHEFVSDPKYDGEKTSRYLMLDETASSETDSASEEMRPETDHSDHETATKCEVGDMCATTDAPTGCPSTPQHDGDLSSLRKVREEDRKKGRAISRQIALWDSLLDARIRLQKSVTAGNRLPPYTADQQLHAPLIKMLGQAQLLANEMFDFQEHLLLVNESIQPPPRKRRRSVEIEHPTTDYGEELKMGSHAVSELECTYHPHLVQTLNKWSSKIQAVAPSVLLPSNRNAFSRTAQHIKSAPRLIDETLADHSKVLSRTRTYRGKDSRLGVNTAGEEGGREKEDAEVFDDTDFYHQLLRDVIDGGRNGTSGNDDLVAAQKGKRVKKKVDTKASKGRKLRYEVHEKIQNFMVPVSARGSWHEEQIDELFGSLLGNGFEGDTEGFRVFG